MKRYNKLIIYIFIATLYLFSQINILGVVEAKKDGIQLTYIIDHKKIMSQEIALQKGTKLYVEINELVKLLNIGMKYQNEIIYLSTEDEVTIDEIFFEEVTILKIDKDSRQFTILPKSSETVSGESITILMGKKTSIEYPLLERVFPFDSLREGMKVSISCLGKKMQTKPLYEATYIEIIANSNEVKGLVPAIEDVYIIAINKEKEYIIVAPNQGNKVNEAQQVMVHIDHHTNIKDQLGKNDYKIDNIQIGQKVSIITNGIKTKSIPMQTVGLEIILVK